MRSVRLFTLVLGIVVCVWFVLGIRQAHDVAAASSVLSQSGRLTVAESAHVASQLQSAQVLNPDTAVDLLRAQLTLDENRPTAAEHIVESVVRREPLNLEGWYRLASAAGRDPNTLLQALRQIRRLEPPLVTH